MYKVNILASENSMFSTVYGPLEMLLQVGVFWNHIKGLEIAPQFQVNVTTWNGKPVTNITGAMLTPHRAIHHNDKYDLLLIPSEGMSINRENESFQARVRYIRQMSKKGSLVASACSGAFLLAEAELLNDQLATTHWALSDQFQSMYPHVKLDTDLLVADNGAVITSGGVTADLDLTMHLIKRLCGEETALETSRCTLVDFTHTDQREYKIFVANKRHDDAAILNCQQYIEERMSEIQSVMELANRFGMSARSFNRRFKAATGETALRYMQKIKLEEAKRIIQKENTSFEFIANKLGYENVSFFRRLFKSYTGLSPKEYRFRYKMSEN